jgi:hypothetical protein
MGFRAESRKSDGWIPRNPIINFHPRTTSKSIFIPSQILSQSCNYETKCIIDYLAQQQKLKTGQTQSHVPPTVAARGTHAPVPTSTTGYQIPCIATTQPTDPFSQL